MSITWNNLIRKSDKIIIAQKRLNWVGGLYVSSVTLFSLALGILVVM